LRDMQSLSSLLFGVKRRVAHRARRYYHRIRECFRWVAALRYGREFGAIVDYFDSAFYLAEHDDVRESGVDAFAHFRAFGRSEGRTYRVFDHVWYLASNPDVRATGKNALDHYNEYGAAEGRRARYITSTFTLGGNGRSDYAKWLVEHAPLLEAAARSSAQTTSGPLISVIMATYNTPETFLRECVGSLQAQTYLSWELCIADDASTDAGVVKVLTELSLSDARIRFVRRPVNGHISAATNDALKLATGDFVAFVDHDDLLEPDALSAVASLLSSNPELDIVYTDEDKVNGQGERYDPYFKPDYNYELLLAQNYFNHLTVMRREKVLAVGGLREGYEGAQDHDLVLRMIQSARPEHIAHIPRVLYHWRAAAGSTALAGNAKTYAMVAGRAAVQDHLDKLGVRATVDMAPGGCGHYRVRYDLAAPPPRVTVIIPTRDRADILSVCLDSLLTRTTYRNFDVIIVDNGSSERATFDLFRAQPQDRVSIVQVNEPFNFSRLNNIAAAYAQGDVLCFLNNDIEVKSSDWMEEMLGFALQPDVGCVGARLWYPDMTLQHGGVILGIGGVAGHAHKHFERNAHGYFCRAAHHQSFSAVTAACLMIRRPIFEAVGGLDEGLAVAFNDVDFCLRVRSAGYRNVWTPYAELIHHESASRGLELTPEQRKRFEGEVNYMLRRWGDVLDNDPAYSPNLTLTYEDFSYAWPPRIATADQASGAVATPHRARS